MALIQNLKRSRERFLDRHVDADDWFAKFFSATTYALWKSTRPLLRDHCAGTVLDAGSGRGSWRNSIMRSASLYESIDLAPRNNDTPTWIGSIMDMPDVPAGRYDTVYCQQVLEHVREPLKALSEMYRVLKPGGTVILGVPHLSRRHELPHDYFRVTQEGIAALLDDTGFMEISVRPYGGLLSFLHHQTSFVFPGLLMGTPLLGELAGILNAPVSWLLSDLDQILDRESLFPAGVLATARKPR